MDQDRNQRLDKIIALLKLLSQDKIAELTKISDKKKKILNACDGKTTLPQLGKKIKVSHEYVRLTVKDFESTGLIIWEKKCPLKVI